MDEGTQRDLEQRRLMESLHDRRDGLTRVPLLSSRWPFGLNGLGRPGPCDLRAELSGRVALPIEIAGGTAIPIAVLNAARDQARGLAAASSAVVEATVAQSSEAIALQAALTEVGPVHEQREAAQARLVAAVAERERVIASGNDPRGTRAAIAAAQDELTDIAAWAKPLDKKVGLAQAALDEIRPVLWQAESKRHLAAMTARRQEVQKRLEQAVQGFAAELVEIHETEVAFKGPQPAREQDPLTPAIEVQEVQEDQEVQVMEVAAEVVVEAQQVAEDDTPLEAPATASSGGDGAKSAAESFLREMLKGGPVASNVVIELAKAYGISESTLKRAKGEVGVISKKCGVGWTLELPAEEGQAAANIQADDSQTSEFPTVGNSPNWVANHNKT